MKESVDQLAKANGVRWYGHVLRRDGDHALRKALEFNVNEPRKRGRPKKTWKRQVEEEIRKVGLRREDAPNRARWRESDCHRSEVNPATPVFGDKPGLKLEEEEEEEVLNVPIVRFLLVVPVT